MAKSRFVLRYRGQGALPSADVARVAELSSVVVIDASPRMLLVESDPDELQDLIAAMAEWMLAPERAIPLLDVRSMGERPSGDTSR